MKQSLMQRSLVRVGIVGVWLCVLAILILIPRFHFVEKNSITIFTWSGVFSPEYIKKFEQETGIKVYLSYYSSNEELLVKLRATQGRGYDIVIPSDYAVQKLIDENLLKKIDVTRLNFFEKINPLLLIKSFHNNELYALPFVWEVYLVGLTTLCKETQTIPADAWDLIFKPEQFTSDYRLIMVNDPIEALSVTARYLFGKVGMLTSEQIQLVQNLLRHQSNFVEGYTNVRTDYYLGTNNAMAALAQSAELWRAFRDYTNIHFIVPQKTFITIEHCAIPQASTKDDLVYQFLNYMYTKESFVYHFNLFRSCPARTDVISELLATQQQKDIMELQPNTFNNYFFMQDSVPEQKKHDIWISVKS